MDLILLLSKDEIDRVPMLSKKRITKKEIEYQREKGYRERSQIQTVRALIKVKTITKKILSFII
jgi:cystathionine beta-lyase family protein involved in aluminum resistance